MKVLNKAFKIQCIYSPEVTKKSIDTIKSNATELITH